jgi:hypothetical protein
LKVYRQLAQALHHIPRFQFSSGHLAFPHNPLR